MLPQQHTTVFQTGPLFADSNPLTWKALYPFCWPLMSEAFQQKVTGSEKGSKNKRWKSKRREGLATSLACNAGVLFGRVNAKKLAIIYWTGHVWFRLRVYGRGRGREKAKRTILTAPEPSSLLLLDRCSPQPSAAIKISDDSCNFHQDNTRHSPAKITPAPQANTSLKGTHEIWPFVPPFVRRYRNLKILTIALGFIASWHLNGLSSAVAITNT